MKKNNKDIRKEKGSAILLTLGILSLVLVMAMAFAFTSRTNLQIAKVSSNSIKAKLMAENALQNVLSQLVTDGDTHKYITRNIDNSLFMYSLDGNGEAIFTKGNYTGHICESQPLSAEEPSDYYKKTNYLPGLLLDRSDFLAKLEDKAATGHKISDANVGFTSILDGTDLIGRYAFVVIDDSYKLDINSIIPFNDNDAHIPWYSSPSDIFPMTNCSGGFHNEYYYYNFYKVGASNTEKFDAGLSFPVDSGTGIVNLEPQGFGVRELGSLLNAGYYNHADDIATSKKLPWQSYSHLLNNDDIKTQFGNDIFALTFYSGLTPESYFKDGKEYARFDLSGYEWRSTPENSFYVGGYPSTKGSWSESNNDTEESYNDFKTTTQKLVRKLVSTRERTCFWRSDEIKSVLEFDGIQSGDVNDVPGVDGSGFGIPYLLVNDTVEDSYLNSITDPVEIQKLQVAANIVNFCDPWYRAVYYTPSGCDFDKLESANKVPVYFGNAYAPYFNELALQLSAKCAKDSGTGKFKYTVGIKGNVEMAFLYGDEFPRGLLNYTPKIKVIIKGKYSIVSEGASDAWHDFTKSATLSSDLNFISGQKYKVLPFTFDSGDEIKTEETPATETPDVAPRKTAKVQIHKVIMYSGKLDNSDERYMDLAVWKTDEKDAEFSDSNGVIVMNTDGDTDWITNYLSYPNGSEYQATLEARDPAFNYSKTNLTDLWRWKESAGYKYSKSTSTGDWSFATLNDENSCYYYNDPAFTPGVNCDMKSNAGDTYSQVGGVDSAVDMMTPFLRLYDLGAVHRGQIGCTLNLLKYNKDDDTLAEYSKGDARILDQVKMGPAKFSKGKVFALVANKSGAAAQSISDGLFAGTVTTRHTDALSELTDENDHLSPVAIAAKCTEGTWQSVGGAGSNSLDDEEDFVNAVALTGTRYESFTIVVVAQSLREIDLIGVAAADKPAVFAELSKTLASPVKYVDRANTYYCDVLGTYAMMVHVLRDTWTNKFKIVGSEKLR